jgi:hypothetical protein
MIKRNFVNLRSYNVCDSSCLVNILISGLLVNDDIPIQPRTNVGLAIFEYMDRMRDNIKISNHSFSFCTVLICYTINFKFIRVSIPL